MSSVDTRVVEMEFDNSDFESGVAQTLSSLTKLKESLHFDNVGVDLSGIRAAVEGIDFDGITSALDVVVDRFSFWGIVADQVIRTIATDVFNLGLSLVRSVITPLTSGGWTRAMNIENARFMIQGLGKDFDALSEDIMYAVDGTAYTFDAAATAAASLAASGIDAGEEMRQYLRGISGIAAQTNSSYADIAAIFTTVAGNGKLMTEQLRQMSFRGMNAAAQLADFFNKVTSNDKSVSNVSQQTRDAVMAITNGAQITEAQINELVSEGKVSADVFAEAMNLMFGEHATKANETFSGSLANIRAALSKIGQMFAAPIIQQMPDVFNAIRENVNQIKSMLTPLIDDSSEYNKTVKNLIHSFGEWIAAADFSWFQKLIDSALIAIDIFGSLGDAVWDGIQRVRFALMGGSSIDETNVLTPIAEVSESLSSDLDLLFIGFDTVASAVRDFLSLLKPSNEQLALVTDTVATFAKVLGVVWDILTTLFEATVNVFGPTISTLIEVLTPFVKNVLGKIGDTIDRLETPFGSLRDLILRLSEAIGSKAADGLRRAFEIIEPVVTGLADVFDRLVEAVGKVVDIIATRLEPALDRIRSFFKEHFGSVGSAFSGVIEFIFNLFGSALDFVANALGQLIELDPLSAIADFFGSIGETIGNVVSAINFTGVFDALSSGFANASATVSSIAGSFATSVVDAVTVFFEDGIVPAINAAFEALQNIDWDTISSVVDNILRIWNSIQLSGLIRALTGLAQATEVPLSALNSLFTNLNSFFTNLSKVLKAASRALNAAAILELAISVGILVLAFTFLVDAVSKADVPSIIISLLIAAALFGGLIYVLHQFMDTAGEASDIFSSLLEIGKGFSKSAEFASIAAILVAIAIDLAVLAGVVYLFSSLDPDRFGVAIFSLVAIIAGIAALVEIVKRIDTSAVLTSAFGLFLVGMALGSIAEGIGYLYEVVKHAAKDNAVPLLLVTVGALVASLVGFAALVKSSKLNWAQILQIGSALSGIGKAMKNVVTAIKDLSGVDFWVAVVDAALLIAAVMALIYAVREVAKLDSFKIAAVVGSIIALTLSLVVIALAIRILAGIDVEDAATSVLSIVSVLFVMSIIVNAMNKLDPLSMVAAAGSLAILSSALVVIAVALRILQGADMGGMAGSVIGLIITLYTMSVVLQQLSKNSKLGLLAGAGALLIVSAALLVVTFALRMLSGIDMESAIKSTVALIAVLAGMTIALKTLSESSKLNLLAGAGALLILSAALVIISTSLLMLAGLDTASLITSAVTLVAALFGLSVILKFISGQSGHMLRASAALLILSGALVVIAVALRILAGLSLEELVTSVVGFGAAMIILVAALYALSAISGTVMPTALSLIILSIGLLALSVAFVALEKMDMMSLAKSALALVGSLVVMIIALAVLAPVAGMALLAAIAIAIVAFSLGAIANAIKTLSESLDAFKDVGDAPAHLGEVLGAIVGAMGSVGGVVTSLTAWTGGLNTAADAIIKLAPIVDAFRNVGNAGDNIGKVVDGIVQGLSNGSLDNVVQGGHALATASEGLIDLSRVLAAYAQDVAARAPGNIRAVCEAVVNGVAGLNGQNNAGEVFSGVADGLRTLGPALKYFGEDLTTEAENFKTICKKIGEGMHSFGVPDEFANSFAVVAAALERLGPALSNFESVDGGYVAQVIKEIAKAFVGFNNIDFAKASAAGNAFEQISAGIQNFPTDVSGLSTALDTAGQSMTDFSGDYGSMLEGLMGNDENFETWISGFTEQFGTAGLDASQVFNSQFMAGLFTGGSGEGGEGSMDLTSMLSSNIDMDAISSLGEQVGLSFSSGMSSDEVSAKAGEMVQATGTALSEGVESIDAAQYSRKVVSDYVSGFHGNWQSIVAGVYTIGVSVANGLKKAESAFSKAGSDAANAFLQGLTVKSSSLEAKGRSMANSVAAGIRQGASASAANQVGRDFVQGFINGVNMQAFWAYAAGMHIGNQAMKGLKFSLNSKSPSRKAMEVGGYFTEGFIIGINKDVAGAEKSAFSLGTAADRALNSAISGALSWFDDNNGEVTITPVLDLSQIQSGAKTMQSMLGSSAPNLNAGYSAPMLVGADTVAARGNAQSVVYQFDFGNAVLNNDADMQNAALNLLETLKRKADMYG